MYLTLPVCVDSGIRFLHKKKVIHRDLKPENILRKIVHKNQVSVCVCVYLTESLLCLSQLSCAY